LASIVALGFHIRETISKLPAMNRFGIFVMWQMPRERRRSGKLSTHDNGEKGYPT